MKKLLYAFLALMLSSPAFGATTPNSFVTPQSFSRGLVLFIQGTDIAGTYKTIYTAGANGSRCYGLYVTNDDSVTAHSVQVSITNAAVLHTAVNIAMPLSTGTGYQGLLPVVLTANTNWPGLPTDQYGNPYIQLISGDTLQLTFTAALSAASQINGFVSCSDF